MKLLPHPYCLVLLLGLSRLDAQTQNNPTSIEDLTSLSLQAHPLTAIPPLSVEKDIQPDFTREMVRLQWRDNDPIYLFVVTPKAIKKPPVILYLYSYPSEVSRFLDTGFCNLQARNGFAAAGFVSSLTGHRYHDRPMSEWFVSELQESLVESVHDVSMILDYLATRSDIDSTRVGMFGEGSGGTIAILSASVDPRLKAIDLLDPWGDWPNWLATSTAVPDEERAAYLKPDFLKRIAPLDPTHKLPSLSLPIRYQYLTKADATPQSVRDRLQTALPSQALFIPKDKALAAYIATRGSDFFDWLKGKVR